MLSDMTRSCRKPNHSWGAALAATAVTPGTGSAFVHLAKLVASLKARTLRSVAMSFNGADAPPLFTTHIE